MQATIAALGYVVIVVLGVSSSQAPAVDPDRRAPDRRDLAAAGSMWLLVAVPSLLQVAVPSLLTALERSPRQIGHGQLWRLVTSAVTQDGGASGTWFNLVVLALVAFSAVSVLRARTLWAVFVIGALGCNLLVLAVWPSVGAGNSMATFTVASAVVVLVGRSHPRDRAATVRMAALVVVGVLLLALRDMHGFAVVVGGLTGLTLAGRGPLDGGRLA